MSSKGKFKVKRLRTNLATTEVEIFSELAGSVGEETKCRRATIRGDKSRVQKDQTYT
jgi:hypothetical protein